MLYQIHIKVNIWIIIGNIFYIEIFIACFLKKDGSWFGYNI